MVGSCCQMAIANIPDNPAIKHKFPNQNIKFFLPVKFTSEWCLLTSIPVSESNTSLLIFSQAKIKIAAAIKVENIPTFTNLFSANATDVPTQIGIIATLYIGGLIAAIHNLLSKG